MTKKEEEIWIKKHQIFFVMKRLYKSYSEKFIDDLEKSILGKSDDEIKELFKIHEDKIKNEQWVYYSPRYYHITEFEQVLRS